jgi:hypothetical protein
VPRGPAPFRPAHAGVPGEAIATSLAMGRSTVYRTKRRFVEGNLERPPSEEPLSGEMVRMTQHERLSRETMRRRLAENALQPWRQRR